LNVVRSQLIVSRLSAEANFDYLQYVWNLQGNPPSSLYGEEARSTIREMEGLAVEIAKANQRIFELVQLAPLYFPNTPHIASTTRRIFDYKSLSIKDPPPNLTNDAMLRWKSSALKEAQDTEQRTFSKPVKDLLNLLGKELAKERGD
jgi:hypothetical protein